MPIKTYLRKLGLAIGQLGHLLGGLLLPGLDLIELGAEAGCLGSGRLQRPVGTVEGLPRLGGCNGRGLLNLFVFGLLLLGKGGRGGALPGLPLGLLVLLLELLLGFGVVLDLGLEVLQSLAVRGGLILDLGHGLLVGGHLLLELLDLLSALDDGGLELVDLGGQLDPMLLGLGGLPPDGGGLLLGVPEGGGLLGLGLVGLLLLGLEVVGGFLPLLDVPVDVVELPQEEVGLDLGLLLEGGVEPLGLLLLLLEAAALGLVPPELVVEEDGLRLGLLLGLEGVVVLGGHLGRSRYVLEHLDELLGGLAGDGLDVALEDEEVAGLDEDADLPEGILLSLFGFYVCAGDGDRYVMDVRSDRPATS